MNQGIPQHVKTKAARTCVFRTFGEYMVVLHSGHAPTDEEWSALLAAFASCELPSLRVLVFTYGGAPNARQRASINDVLAGHAPKIAIMTPSALARAVGTAMTWFNPNLSLFGADQLTDVMAHLGAPEHDRPRLKLVLGELERELQRLSGASARSGSKQA